MAYTAHKSEDQIKEHFEDAETVTKKAKQFADMIRSSKHFTAFTGAGISTSAGISDFRGPQGVWTCRAKGIKRTAPTTPKLKAMPTKSHMALVMLQNKDILKQLISQNCDGLHRKSGIRPDVICELHGNTNKETCGSCGREYIRDFDASADYRKSVHDHRTGRKCAIPGCGGELIDSIINFGETLPRKTLEKAMEETQKSDLMVVLGSSLTVSPACDMPKMIGQKKNANLVIVNLQKTPLDKYASLRVFAKTDDFMVAVMKELAIDIPTFILKRWMALEMKDDKLVLRGMDLDGIPATFIAGIKKEDGGVIESEDDGSFILPISEKKVNLFFWGHYNEPPLPFPIPVDTMKEKGEMVFELGYNPLNGKWEMKEGDASLIKSLNKLTLGQNKRKDPLKKKEKKPKKPKLTVEESIMYLLDVSLEGKGKMKVGGTTPPPKSASSGCVVNNTFYLFGGFVDRAQTGKRYYGEMHALDLKTQEWREIKGKGDVPNERSGHSASVIGDQIYIFGGSRFFIDKTYISDVYQFDTKTETWKKLEVSGPKPEGRSFHCQQVWQNRYIGVFGGSELTRNTFFNDVWVFDTQTLKWKKLSVKGTPPEPRDGASCTLLGNKLYIIGGYAESLMGMETYFNEVWVLDLEKITWKQEKVIFDKGRHFFRGRAWHTSSVICGEQILLFGGCGPGFICNDAFVFSPSLGKMFKVPETGTWPSPRHFQSMFVIDDTIYVIGGAGEPFTLRDYLNDVSIMKIKMLDLENI